MNKLLKKLKSPALRGGLVALITLAIKRIFELDIEQDFLNELFDVGLIAIGVIAGFNNPDDLEKF